MARKPALAIVCGPTASGKTQFAISLAQKLGSEIICADSRQVFSEMRIGTARPDFSEMQGIPHHLCGHISIHDTWHAGKFEQEALEVIERLLRQQRTPVVCGGTGLYLKALCSGLDPLPPRNETLRKELQAVIELQGIDTLAQILLELDPNAAQSIDLKNPQRIIRAIELLKAGNAKSLASMMSKPLAERPFRCVFLGMELERTLLYERINHRVDRMIEAGLKEEAQRLYSFRHLESLQTVGYSEIFQWMDGEYTLNEAINAIKQNTRRYAKRQLTWLRHQAEVNWLNPLKPESIEHALSLLD